MANEFGKKMKIMRLETNLTQKQIAEQLGKSESTIRMWELGKNEPNISSLISLSHIFNCTLDFLLGNDLNNINVIPTYALPDAITDKNIESLLPLPSRYISDGNGYIGIICTDSSMSPKIEKNDYILVKLQETCFEGQTAVVQIADDKTVIRKILFSDGGLLLQPLNSNFDTVFYSEGKINDMPVDIIGTAVEIFRDI